jgi:hypothetical protein
MKVMAHEPVPGMVSIHLPPMSDAFGGLAVARAAIGTGGPAASLSKRLLLTVSPHPESHSVTPRAANHHGRGEAAFGRAQTVMWSPSQVVTSGHIKAQIR